MQFRSSRFHSSDIASARRSASLAASGDLSLPRRIVFTTQNNEGNGFTDGFYFGASAYMRLVLGRRVQIATDVDHEPDVLPTW